MKNPDIDIPMLKKKRLDDFLGLPLEAEVKKELMSLKHLYEVDHLEWVRQLIKTHLPIVKEKLKGT